MLKHAYQLGYEAAIKEAGFGSTLKGVAEAAGGRIKDIGRPLSEAVQKMRRLQQSGAAIMNAPHPAYGGMTGPEALSAARGAVFKETIPWLAAPGAAGLYYGGKAIGKSVFPDSEKSTLERLFSLPPTD